MTRHSEDSPQPLAPQELLDTKDLAQFLHVPVATVRQWRYKGAGSRGSKVGRHVRYRRADVEKWLDQQADRPEVA